jgi:allantoicase
MHDFTDLIDVAAERLGGRVVAANDEFFAPKERLLLPNAAEWREGVYTERGKWMDGWETRRRREPGHDWCIIRLGVPALVRGVVVDTAWFRGNFPESCSLDGTAASGSDAAALAADGATSWRELLPRQYLAGDTRNLFPVAAEQHVTHVRLNIFPDGGVARLRVHGIVVPDPRLLRPDRPCNLAAMELGAFVVACSDMFFGHRQNLILPGRSTHMGDGWETKRRRGPGFDWSIVKLAARGEIEWVEIDTDHYKGNAPARCSVDALDDPHGPADALTTAAWSPLLGSTPLQPDARHRFEVGPPAGPASHVRLSIEPDGGVARLRVYGRAIA